LNRGRFLLPLLLLALLAVTPASAGARPAPVKPPAAVEIGRVSVGNAGGDGKSILVPVRYPIALSGRNVVMRVSLSERGGGTVRSWVLHDRLSSGPRHSPEKRRRFTFVHRLDFGGRPGGDFTVSVQVVAVADVDGDGVGFGGFDQGSQPLREARGSKVLCSSVPHLRARPGQRAWAPLPACTDGGGWAIGRRPAHGEARIRHGKLVYWAPRRFRGSEEIGLVRKRGGPAASAVEPASAATAQVTVGTATGVVVRALGDSVTAGFGYYSNGAPMTIGRLLGCRPPAQEFDDACSSNSLVTANTQKLDYAPDYGLSNNISWAAQWANEHGVTDYENLAVSGSEPSDWAPEGDLHKTTQEIEAEDPDYILMTVGANPLLSNMLFGIDNMGCAVSSDILGGYRECIERAFREVHLHEALKALYEDLVAHTSATIYLMQYHLSVPSSALAYSATQIAEMGVLLNGEIAAVAAEVNPRRLQVVSPPHFNVGIDISPVYPSAFSCSRFGYTVDGPSVQSNPTQDELEVLHPLSFCEGPEGGGPPWVIGGDTGIHPSAAGYAQMAAQVPPPTG
jgi:lysophospholipase L1-like esterase